MKVCPWFCFFRKMPKPRRNSSINSGRILKISRHFVFFVFSKSDKTTEQLWTPSRNNILPWYMYTRTSFVSYGPSHQFSVIQRSRTVFRGFLSTRQLLLDPKYVDYWPFWIMTGKRCWGYNSQQKKNRRKHQSSFLLRASLDTSTPDTQGEWTGVLVLSIHNLQHRAKENICRKWGPLKQSCCTCCTYYVIPHVLRAVLRLGPASTK